MLDLLPSELASCCLCKGSQGTQKEPQQAWDLRGVELRTREAPGCNGSHQGERRSLMLFGKLVAVPRSTGATFPA